MDAINGTISEVLKITWPTLFISLVLIVAIRIGYLLKNKQKFVLYKEILALMFMLYILCLFQIVTAQDINSYQGNNFDLFSEIFRYEIGSRLFFKNILGNVIMFIPYGFFACMYIDLKEPLKALGLSLMASVAIEYTQSMIGRIFDVDDIFLNVIGGMIGYSCYLLVSYLGDKIPLFRKKWFLNIVTTLIFIVLVLFVVWRIA